MANYVVFDLEWNAPISRGKIYRNDAVDLYGEIIQIGAVKLNDELDVIDTFSTMVKPQYYTKMNKEISELTSITDADLEKGISFKEAAENFLSWCGEDAALLSWGDSDLQQLEDNSLLHGMSLDWIPEWFDAQLMFDDQITMEGRSFSLDYACYTFGITGSAAHDALHDAIATAEVMKRLEVASWIEEERAYREEEAV